MCVAVYWQGLNGPFLFDDHVHITKNQWVKIDSLHLQDLKQAWNSSFSRFPGNRPLAQLTFGINHATAGGLTPGAFKATNLLIHVLVGISLMFASRLFFRSANFGRDDRRREIIFALLVTAIWLLHPLNVSTVLYTVQRMTQLSSLGMLLGLTSYIWGRLQLAHGRSGLLWMLASVPCALIGFLGKENAALFPMLLLVVELTLLRRVPIDQHRRAIYAIWSLLIALPIAAAVWYVATHPGIISYAGRPFTLEERLLTESRVIWQYISAILVPDITSMGLFHDDIRLSSSLTDPPSTMPATLGIIVLIGMALISPRRTPLASFGILFFFANHLLESTVIPLEIKFEHRNYLASIGVLILAAQLLMWMVAAEATKKMAPFVIFMLAVTLSFATFLRVGNWSSLASFAFDSVKNHPQSPRSNFMAAQLLIASLDSDRKENSSAESLARHYLARGLEIDQNCANCLFGLIVLDIHVNKPPPDATLNQLKDYLRSGDVGPTRVAINQFRFLVDWQKGGASSLSNSALEDILDAALENPKWTFTARSSIESAYREYHEFVTKDLGTALLHATRSADAWREQWKPRMNVVRILLKMGQKQEALKHLDVASSVARNEHQLRQTQQLREHILSALGQ